MAIRSVSTLQRARTEPSAFADFYAAHSRDVLIFFARRTFDVEVAADLVAETFAQAFEHRRRFRGSSDAEATGWLYGIARHQLSRYVRNRQAERRAVQRLGIQLPTIAPGDYERIVELAGLTEMRNCVAAAFDDLTGDHREALRLRVLDERPYPEVADQLGVSEPTARARVSRALRQLADALDMKRTSEATP